MGALRNLTMAAGLVFACMPCALAEDTTAQTSSSTSPAASAETADPVICRREQQMGSRIGGHEVCLKKSQWEQRSMEDRRNLEKSQSVGLPLAH